MLLTEEEDKLKIFQVKVTGAHERVLCDNCQIADGPLTRLRGLMGRRRLSRGEGMLLKPAPSIHTFFMRFPIDAVFVDSGLNVVGVRADVAPWRVAGQRGARGVLELPAGEARRLGVLEGMQLELADGTSAGSRRASGGGHGR
jgi:uncharacterized membrane protein (UPF0127 family)